MLIKMLIKISTDVWRDVFDFLSLTDRRQLSLKFNKLGDREFSNVCQKWLHEWIKNVCLQRLWIDSDRDSKLARLIKFNQTQEDKVPFADVEMPDNINDFQEIRIKYLDTSVLNFLRQLQPLFRGVNLLVYFQEKSLEATRTALTHLMPLFSDGGIELLELINFDSNQLLLLTFRDNFHAQFLGIKTLDMAHIAGIGEFVELYLPWLSTRRADGQPRTLLMQCDNASIMEIIDRIRQDFLNPTSGPISFFISRWNWKNPSFPGIMDSITQNGSGEQLVIGKPMVDENVDYLLIGRCPAEVDGQTWIGEMHRKYEKADPQIITIVHPTIGQIEGTQQQMDENGNEIVENGEEQEDADQQPGPSNLF